MVTNFLRLFKTKPIETNQFFEYKDHQLRMLKIECDMIYSRLKKNLLFFSINFFNAILNIIFTLFNLIELKFDFSAYYDKYQLWSPFAATIILLSALGFLSLLIKSGKNYKTKAGQYNLVLSRLKEEQRRKHSPEYQKTKSYEELFEL